MVGLNCMRSSVNILLVNCVSVPEEITHKERFWDRITRERMSEVGSGRSFDVMVRGEYRPENGEVDPVVLGSDPVTVDADITSFDLEGRYFRLYDVDFSPPAMDIGRDKSISRGRKLSSILKGLEGEWRYEMTSIPYDVEASIDDNQEPVQGTVYWPEYQDFPRDEVYQDFVDLVGSDILSRL